MQMKSAAMQYQLAISDLEVLLALVRAGTLGGAAQRLGVDNSTVFRTVQRVEKGLGQRLFERTRAGFVPSELSLELASHAEAMEVHIEAARSVAQAAPGSVSGSVRITSTDTIMHGLVIPVLSGVRQTHPGLSFELHTGNELANLTRRDADIALRATKRPPQHLIGKRIGPIRVAVYAAKKGLKRFDFDVATSTAWVAPDDALPEHPSVVWRRRHFPKIKPSYRVGSILTAVEVIGSGAAIGVVPIFLAAQRSDLRQLTDPIDECETDLWLLTHTETRHLRRVSEVYSVLAEKLNLG